MAISRSGEWIRRWRGLSPILGGGGVACWLAICNSVVVAYAGLFVWGPSFPGGAWLALCDWTFHISIPFIQMTISIHVWHHNSIVIHLSSTPKPFRIFIGASIVLHIFELEWKDTRSTAGGSQEAKLYCSIAVKEKKHMTFL